MGRWQFGEGSAMAQVRFFVVPLLRMTFWWRTGMGPRMREDNGWGSGLPFSSSRGQAVSGGMGMGPRIREDTGGKGSRPRLHGGRL